MLVTQSRILYKKLVQVSCTRNLHQILTQISCTRNLQMIKKQRQTMQTTTKQQIIKSLQTSQTTTSLNFGHVSASFLHWTELCSIWCKILVQGKTWTRKHDTVKFLVQVDVYKFLVPDSWKCVTGITVQNSHRAEISGTFTAILHHFSKKETPTRHCIAFKS